MKRPLIWTVAAVLLLALVTAGVFFTFSPQVQYRTLSGPVAIVQGDPPTHGLLGIGFETDPPVPLTVVHVTEGSGAAQAGIQPGDVIVAIEEQTSPAYEDVVGIVRNFPPGATLRLTIQRDGVEQDLEVALISFTRLLELREQEGPGAPPR